MSKFNLDLSKFKKISDGDGASVLRHADGHELKIAHKGLSSRLKEQLSNLPVRNERGEQMLAMTGMVEGGGQAAAPAEKSLYDKAAFVGNSILNYGSEEYKAKNEHADKYPGQIKSEPGIAPGELTSNAPTTNQPQSDMGQSVAEDPYLSAMDKYTAGQVAGVQQSTAGEKQMAEATGQMGVEQAGQIQQQLDDLQQKQQNFQRRRSFLDDQDQKTQMDIANAHIDPNRVLKNMTTGGQIASTLGLIIGGMGSGLTGGPNLAYDFLEKSIDRDIASQKEDIDKGQNLLSHNLGLMKNVNDAEDLTRIQTYQMIEAKLKQAAASSQDPIQQGRINVIAGDARTKIEQLKQDNSMKHVMFGGSGGGDEEQFKRQTKIMRMTPGYEKLAEDLEKKHIPGVGQAGQELTPDNRQEWLSMNDLETTYKAAQKYMDSVGKFGAGWQNAHAKEGETLKQAMELQTGKLLGLNRFTHEEGVKYKSMAPDLAGTKFTDQDQAQINVLMGELQRHKSEFLKSVNAPVQKNVSRQTSQNQFEGKTASTADGQQYIYKNGDWVNSITGKKYQSKGK